MKELADGTLRVEIDIDPPHKKAFYELFPTIDMPVGIAPLNPVVAIQGVPEAQEEPKERTLAQRMHIDGYFYNRKLWAALDKCSIYTQEQHKTRIEHMPCCWREVFAVSITQGCVGHICAHHCNSAALPAAGKTTNNPRKVPHWYTVPLCAITHHTNGVHGSWCTRDQKEKLLQHAVELTAQQVKRVVKSYIGIESLSEITQEMLDNFERQIGL